MSHIGKRYRIEQSFASPDGGVLVSGSGDGRIGEILSTVQDLRRCFEPSQRRAGEVIEAYRREIAELYGLRAELDSMKGAIASTKREIATLRRSEDDGGGMRRAAGELDAVIEATEDATTTILAAAEEIESHATMLRAAGEQRHERAPGESALLNGPRLADDVGHVTQDDIDALFN
jgi:chemotaxis protein CheZ